MIVGVVGGMPLLNTTIEVDGVEKTFGIVNSITSGFGGTLGSIGIITVSYTHLDVYKRQVYRCVVK